MIYNLIVDVPSLPVGSFDSSVGFHYQVCYGRASFGVKLLDIFHSLVYIAPLECLDDPADSVAVDNYAKLLQTWHFLSEILSII